MTQLATLTYRTAAAAAAILALAGCGSDSAEPAPPASTPSAAAPSATPTVDPYKAYQKIAPDGAPKLSREDAQTRALLGCGQTWAPGTVDAALAEAYAELCKNR